MEAGGTYAHRLLEEELASTANKAGQATTRLKRLERDKQKLIDAYMAEAISAEDLRPRQEAISREMAALRAQEAEHGADAAKLHHRLDEVIAMAHDAAQLYKVAPESAKQHLLHALFAQLKVELHDEHGLPAVSNRQETTPVSEGVLTHLTESVLEVVKQGSATSVEREAKTPGKISPTGGSNVIQLAEREGFEPSKAFTPCRFSRPVPSTTRTPLRALWYWYILTDIRRCVYGVLAIAATITCFTPATLN